jgi:hypothetical protein
MFAQLPQLGRPVSTGVAGGEGHGRASGSV